MPSFLDALSTPAYNALLSIAVSLDPVTGGSGAAAAVVLLTCLVRLLLVPLTVRQIRTQRRSARLAPEVERLRQRFRRDPQRLSRELRALYRRAGVSPLAVIGTGLLQLPFFWLVFHFCSASTVGGHPNKLLGHALWGAPLDARLVVDPSGTGVLAFVVLAVVAVLIGWLGSRQSRRLALPGAPAVLRLLPYAVVVSVAVLPLAAAICVVTSAACSLAITHVTWREAVIYGPPRTDRPSATNT